MKTDIIEAIVQAETMFPQTFADMEERDWGVLFVTPTIPDSHDGNHASVLNRSHDPASVVDEIVMFYESRGLAPRVNYVSADGDYAELHKALDGAGFTFGYEGAMNLFRYQGPSRIAPNPDVHVRRIDTVDADMLAELVSIDNQRMARVLQRRTARPDDWLFVGHIDGRPVSVALLEIQGDVCRVDEVHTAEPYRCRGCARAVMHSMIEFYEEHSSLSLYLWTDNPIAERIYVEAGFVKMEHSLTSWFSWRG